MPATDETPPELKAAVHDALSSGRYEEAAALANKVLAQSPDDDTIHLPLAFAYEGLGRFDEALAVHVAATEADRRSAMSWQGRGVALLRLGKDRESLRALERAVELEPTNTWAINALGFRIGDVGYMPDVSDIPQQAWGQLEGLAMWILDALRYKPHPSHVHLARSLEWISRAAPKGAILTNMHVDLDYATLCHALPPGVVPAYDGLEYIQDAATPRA